MAPTLTELLHNIVRHASLGQQHIQLPGHSAGNGVNAEPDLDSALREFPRQLCHRLLSPSHSQSVTRNNDHALAGGEGGGRARRWPHLAVVEMVKASQPVAAKRRFLQHCVCPACVAVVASGSELTTGGLSGTRIKHMGTVKKKEKKAEYIKNEKTDKTPTKRNKIHGPRRNEHTRSNICQTANNKTTTIAHTHTNTHTQHKTHTLITLNE